MKKKPFIGPLGPPRGFAFVEIQVAHRPDLFASLYLDFTFEPARSFTDGSLPTRERIWISDRFNRVCLPSRSNLRLVCTMVLAWLDELEGRSPKSLAERLSG